MSNKTISYKLYGGSSAFDKKKTPYELEEVTCSNSENCPAFKEGHCPMVERISRWNGWHASTKCPFSEVSTKKGQNARSKKYMDLYYQYYDNKDVLKKDELRATRDIMFFEVGDYYYLDLHNINTEIVKCHTRPVNKPQRVTYNSHYVRLLDTQSYFDQWKLDYEEYVLIAAGFIEKKLLDIDDFKTLIERCKTEQAKELLKANILKYNSELAKELNITNDEINYVGLQAQLNTLTPPFCFNHNGIDYMYNTNGYVHCNDPQIISAHVKNNYYSSYIGVPEKIIVQFKPNEKVFIEIKDNSWVNSNTVFK